MRTMMLGVLGVLGLGALAVGAIGCENIATDKDALAREDIEAITAGDGQGVVYSGTWVLDYRVAESNCAAFTLPDAFPEQLPIEGETGTEDVVLVQDDGELTRALDEIGEAYLFRGSIGRSGGYTYGSYFTVGGVERIEKVSGTMTLADDGTATLTGTSTRRYVATVVACEARLTLTGRRTAIGGED